MTKRFCIFFLLFFVILISCFFLYKAFFELGELTHFKNLKVGDVLYDRGAYAAIGSNIDFSKSKTRFHVHLISKKRIDTVLRDEKGAEVDRINNVYWKYVGKNEGYIVATSEPFMVSKFGLDRSIYFSVMFITDNEFRLTKIYRNVRLEDVGWIISGMD